METSSRILLVDDEQNLLHLLSLMLMEFGWAVATASRPGEALHMVQAERFQIAFVDNHLGPIEGIELIGKIQDVDPDLPCILMTGNLSIDVTVNAIRNGVAGVLRKPFRVEDLLVSIEQGKRAREIILQQRKHLLERKYQEKEEGSEGQNV
jgi:DNA-binding NtrC family response regulator